jgi:hypothetical protein
MIASQPKTGRRTSNVRKGAAKAQVLGKPTPSPAQKARAAAVAGATSATPTAEKIVVSNLPQDVNEAQIKVRYCPVCINPLSHSHSGALCDHHRPLTRSHSQLR